MSMQGLMDNALPKRACAVPIRPPFLRLSSVVQHGVEEDPVFHLSQQGFDLIGALAGRGRRGGGLHHDAQAHRDFARVHHPHVHLTLGGSGRRLSRLPGS